YYSVPTSIEGYSDVKEVSANSYSVIFRRDNGDVYLWGFLFPEVVGDPPLVPTRQHPYTQPVKMQGLSLVESIDARGSGGVARLENGDLYGWYSYIYSPDGGRMIMAPVFIGNIGNYKYTAALDSAVIIGEPTTPSDEVAPVVMGVPDRMANGAGWYKAPVMINWSATDPEPSSGAPSVPAPTVANLEGEHVYTSGESCDPAGNCATGTYTVKLDTVLPAGAFGGNSQLVLRFLGQTISGSSSDVTSGVEKVALTAGNTTLSSDPNGGITLSCDTAKTSCTWTADRTRLPAGAQTYTLTVTDMAGNVYTTTRQYIVL
ncbi:MAG: hypothetical protein JWL85_711, partial [Candidatus Saccharibacteria bacterium]|nr:hypothetical protein [Candidatus Saccharibacteria bacterium]